jgi:CheY-like chemotaxis protein
MRGSKVATILVVDDNALNRSVPTTLRDYRRPRMA